MKEPREEMMAVVVERMAGLVTPDFAPTKADGVMLAALALLIEGAGEEHAPSRDELEALLTILDKHRYVSAPTFVRGFIEARWSARDHLRLVKS